MLQSLAAVGLDGKGATGGPQRAKGDCSDEHFPFGNGIDGH